MDERQMPGQFVRDEAVQSKSKNLAPEHALFVENEL